MCNVNKLEQDLTEVCLLSKWLMMSHQMVVSYLSDQSCVSKRRPDFSTQVELFILHYIYKKQERSSDVSSQNCVSHSIKKSVCKHGYVFLTLVHGHVIFVRVAFADGSHAVQAGRDDDGRGLGQRCERCGRGRGTLGQAHRGSGFGNGSLGKSEVGH